MITYLHLNFTDHVSDTIHYIILCKNLSAKLHQLDHCFAISCKFQKFRTDIRK